MVHLAVRIYYRGNPHGLRTHHVICPGYHDEDDEQPTYPFQHGNKESYDMHEFNGAYAHPYAAPGVAGTSVAMPEMRSLIFLQAPELQVPLRDTITVVITARDRLTARYAYIYRRRSV